MSQDTFSKHKLPTMIGDHGWKLIELPLPDLSQPSGRIANEWIPFFLLKVSLHASLVHYKTFYSSPNVT
jgi:hypothetical protein